ncbi:MAG: LuxR C-terminal-related transcriptional regulator [Muribaculaceae bacterium]
MRKMKLYEADDKMISLIRDNYHILQGLGAFGISLGFGDKTVRQVCEQQNVDTYTFLAVVNFIINGINPTSQDELLSLPTLLQYLKASHQYFLDFQLPDIRRELEEALTPGDNMTALILQIYDEYSRTIVHHMRSEEKMVFPYVETLIRGERDEQYDIQMYSKHHSGTTDKLRELKSIIIKYLPTDMLSNNKLTATLHHIYNNEEWLKIHAQVEDEIFVPAIRLQEKRLKDADVSASISNLISSNAEQGEVLSEREKDVVRALAQGMSNKEVANHLFISLNTVLTHRRNIARKLQIHSPAGLTIYAIVNNLIDISSVKQ